MDPRRCSLLLHTTRIPSATAAASSLVTASASTTATTTSAIVFKFPHGPYVRPNSLHAMLRHHWTSCTNGALRNPALFQPRPSPILHSSSSFHSSTTLGQPRHPNHYERLGLGREATKREIKTQFYKLSKLHHPDKNASQDSRNEFLAINEAYSILGDDRQRRDYDLTLRDRSDSLHDSSSARVSSNRGSLRRTHFRHSAQSSTANAEARRYGAARQVKFGMGQVGTGDPGATSGPIPHFDSKSHQEMHYEQEQRREQRRQERQRDSAEYQQRKQYEAADTASGRFARVIIVFASIVFASSFYKIFADEPEQESEQDRGLAGTKEHGPWVQQRTVNRKGVEWAGP
ncbi:hypothetical protein BGW38_009229 [Lunasporangiospora selenospora]|uniref:J domain-containing protein n=1 Tax=Lunasporangiospora selenospora TaxID=979761 RepID=A0A9P6G2X2_9FUNG|nr:hypothetical protein BGW38_009229 [Lunasporangiospora selenospora]